MTSAIELTPGEITAANQIVEAVRAADWPGFLRVFHVRHSNVAGFRDEFERWAPLAVFADNGPPAQVRKTRISKKEHGINLAFKSRLTQKRDICAAFISRLKDGQDEFQLLVFSGPYEIEDAGAPVAETVGNPHPPEPLQPAGPEVTEQLTTDEWAYINKVVALVEADDREALERLTDGQVPQDDGFWDYADRVLETMLPLGDRDRERAQIDKIGDGLFDLWIRVPTVESGDDSDVVLEGCLTVEDGRRKLEISRIFMS